MGIHKEGYRWLSAGLVLFLGLGLIGYKIHFWVGIILTVTSFIIYLLLLWFFRNPFRQLNQPDPDAIYAPCDGRIVVIEEVHEQEFFKEKRIQVSIFMSPLNVHINWNPVSGEIAYVKHHPGKYLVAWHPKSSSENEMTSTVLQNEKTSMLIRQIAGALARRIVNYMQPKQKVAAGTEMGFIKFGSRVDLLLPLNVKLNVKLDQRVKGASTIIARIPD